ncbi:hypothetical protein NDU88_003870 [Pleurodeles waltl]|uniref:Uncharacterized protein n=1 Tax=Pleurodeles waltl TaxID=8319 RepID=A0AAV7QA86_PLEWA|nr:hypothetical protein NDU88_003870 [Pleurodeles waltl]
MDRWLKPKRKATEDIIDGPSCSKQSDLSQKKTKCRKYDVEYLSMGFTCSGSEHEQQPQCVLCYEILSNEAMKPSKLRRHLETKHKEHATKSTEFFKNKEQELRQSRKIIKKTAIGSFKENALKASYEVSMLIAKAGKPHTIAEELTVPAAKAMTFLESADDELEKEVLDFFIQHLQDFVSTFHFQMKAKIGLKILSI